MRKGRLGAVVLAAAILTGISSLHAMAQENGTAAVTLASVSETVSKLPTMTPQEKIVSLIRFYDIMKAPDGDGAIVGKAIEGEGIAWRDSAVPDAALESALLRHFATTANFTETLGNHCRQLLWQPESRPERFDRIMAR